MQLDGLLELLRQAESYQTLLDHARQGRALPDQRVLRAARPFVLAALAADLARPVLVIAGRVDRAYNIAEQLPVWLPGRPAERFAEPTSIFYERSPWTPAAIQSRLTTLAALAPPIGAKPATSQPPPLIVTSALALMQKTLPAREFRAASRLLRAGTRITPDSLLHAWMQNGYEPASIVVEPGTFSRRGGILDIFPVSARQPVRIEFFGDEVESLRAFDAASQRSSASIEQVAIPPAREALPRFGPGAAERLAGWFAQQPDPAEDVTSALPDEEPLANGAPFPHLEFYLPYFHSQPATLLDYLPEDALIMIDDWGALHDSMADLEEQAIALHRDKLAAGHLPPDYPLPYLTWDELQDELSTRAVLRLGADPELSPPDGVVLGELFAPGQRYGGQLRYVLEELHRLSSRSERAIVVSQQAQRLAELWSEQDTYLPPVSRIASPAALGDLTFVEGTLAEGWTLTPGAGRYHLLTDAELFGWQRPEPRRHVQRRAVPPEATFADLKAGDFVVHVEYGIGRFAGLQKRVIDQSEREYLIIEYAGSDLLYVPIHQADRLSRYIGATTASRRSTGWGRRNGRALRKTAARRRRSSARLLGCTLHSSAGTPSARTRPGRPSLSLSFETEDQLIALRSVRRWIALRWTADLRRCGIRKTEVALRAAFKAVMDGKQVAILVPTTVLAQQHFNTFARRLVSFPIKVEMLSRFRSPAEQRQILFELARGTIDIVIGTHRLLQPDVSFRDLGLLIIDEEQRFGVTHKEQLKQFRTEVDVLTLTATPIPRTLYMSLAGVRDISMIQTPPEERLPVVTHVGAYDDKLVRQAILRELDRGGQVYFVHNRVQSIDAIAAHLRRLVPEASVAVGHGQMDEGRLEEIMTAFARGDYDVLLSTTIIESGLDIPNANTLIVDRSDWFGLAQLYQLRGRVGRGASQAYAYFFHPRASRLTFDARARLETIGEQTELGSGFSIAMRDLEIRGAGDMLGTRQSGHIAAVGFHLYTELLAQAVRHLKGEGEAPHLPITVQTVTIDLPLPAYFPVHYIPETSLRIQLYRRIAEIDRFESIDEMRAELTDRFGTLPRAVEGLLFQIRVKLLAQRANASAIATENGQITIRLPYLASIDRGALQQALGHNTRVSRTGVWLPADGRPEAEWQASLVDVLEKLEVVQTQAPFA
ncbi:MAG: transcription-repair coupling factor [Anaerolineae bacterium]|nr:transcription-repair coupling factor [Anaerolineae bacterium]